MDPGGKTEKAESAPWERHANKEQELLRGLRGRARAAIHFQSLRQASSRTDTLREEQNQTSRARTGEKCALSSHEHPP